MHRHRRPEPTDCTVEVVTMSFDQRTLDLYNSRAKDYVEWSRPAGPSEFLTRMVSRLPRNGSVLDFGCGAGWDSIEFLRCGLSVTAIDGSTGLVEEANRRHNIGAVCMTFDRFDMDAKFDGVWANFTLQHIPRDSLPDVLERISRSLKPHGLLFAGMHAGKDTRRDSLGRLYCHQDFVELGQQLRNVGFADPKFRKSSGKGFEGTVWDHLLLETEKCGDP